MWGGDGGGENINGEQKLGQDQLTLLAPLDLDREGFFLFFHRLVFVVCGSHDFSATFAMLQPGRCLPQEARPLFIPLPGQ